METRNRVKITKILEKSVLASRYYFSPTWSIYNQWLHSLAQQGSPHRVEHRQHSLLTTSHNPIFMRSSKDLWKWLCIIATSGMESGLEVIRCSSLSDKITNWPKTTRKTEICKYQFYMNEDLYVYLSIYLRVYNLHHNVLPTLQSIPLMTNGPLYPITQDSSCHGQHTMPRNPWSFPRPVPHSCVFMNVCVLQWRKVCVVVL